MQHVAKIYRHRHKHHHYINDDLKEVTEDAQYKIIFSHPEEMAKFEKWCVENKGKYDYDKENSMQNGELPKVKEFKKQKEDEWCWCDVMTYYLLHIAYYEFKETISPYKAEVYVKNIYPPGLEEWKYEAKPKTGKQKINIIR